MLPLFGLLLFVLMGLGALTVDVGLALWSQQTMQDAADSASLAGTRNLGGGTPEATAKGTAQGWVTYTFDDDTQLPADARNVGAGPAIAMSGGSGGELQANQGMTVTGGTPAKPLVFKPALQLNAVNATHGDLVVGKYSSVWPVQESDAYVRNDFTAASYSDQARSLLVRLRRTNNFPNSNGDQLDNVTDVSSTGPTLPFLYGRGAVIEKSSAARYSPREHGLTVRATAIGQGRPVLSVGLPHPTAGMAGILPIAFYQGYWSELGGNLADVTVSNLTLSGSTIGNGSGPVGYTVPLLKTVGLEVAPSGLDPASRDVLLEGYFPLYDGVASDPADAGTIKLRVVGYGYGTIEVSSGGSVNLVRMGSALRGRNVSAVPIGAPQLNTAEWAEVLRLNGTIFAVALAPGLVR